MERPSRKIPMRRWTRSTAASRSSTWWRRPRRIRTNRSPHERSDMRDLAPMPEDPGYRSAHPGYSLLRRAMQHHLPLAGVAHQGDVAVDAVDELAVGQGDEQREHHAEMQRQ